MFEKLFGRLSADSHDLCSNQIRPFRPSLYDKEAVGEPMDSNRQPMETQSVRVECALLIFAIARAAITDAESLSSGGLTVRLSNSALKLIQTPGPGRPRSFFSTTSLRYSRSPAGVGGIFDGSARSAHHGNHLAAADRKKSRREVREKR